MNQRTALLHNGNGGSDKVYLVSLEGQDNLWVVNFRYGRRVPGDGYQIQGTAGGTKTSVPQPYDGAVAIYEDLVRKQQSDKGYTLISETNGSDGVAPESIKVVKDVSGHLPMLLKEVKDEAHALQLCQNPAYAAQEKQDGERRMVQKLSGLSVKGINRKGEYVAIPQAVRNETELIVKNSYLIDGEEIGETYRAFDLLESNYENHEQDSMQVRYERLRNLIFHRNDRAIQVVYTAFTTAAKLALFHEVKARGGEGLVFKLVAAPYESGRSKYALKWKFKSDPTTVRVIAIHPSKRSIQVGAWNGKDLTPVGNVTIPVNHEIPEIGSFVDVQYLYYFLGGSLFQSVYLGWRHDKDQADLVSSLKVKGNPDVDDQEESDEEVPAA